MIFLVLIFMFFLGCIQILWAIVQAIATHNPNTRRHFGFYGIGVVAYFVLLYALYLIGGDIAEQNPIAVIHFFASALGLAIYHVYIVVDSYAHRKDHVFAEEYGFQEQ